MTRKTFFSEDNKYAYFNYKQIVDDLGTEIHFKSISKYRISFCKNIRVKISMFV